MRFLVATRGENHILRAVRRLGIARATDLARAEFPGGRSTDCCAKAWPRAFRRAWHPSRRRRSAGAAGGSRNDARGGAEVNRVQPSIDVALVFAGWLVFALVFWLRRRPAAAPERRR